MQIFFISFDSKRLIKNIILVAVSVEKETTSCDKKSLSVEERKTLYCLLKAQVKY